MPAKVNSAFDIAFYFTNKAARDNSYLQPQKLQSLLYLAQAYFCIAAKGQKLMPAVFVADERGPLEPNVYMAFSNGPPNIDINLKLPSEIEGFLNTIWRRFGSISTDKLIQITQENKAYKTAKERGHRAEILLKDMALSLNSSEKKMGTRKDSVSNIYRTQYGKAVTVKKWEPKAQAKGN